MRTSIISIVCLTAALGAAAPAAAADLTPVASFGDNPGALAMYEYVPDGLPAGRPVVVVLHGCTQTAADAVRAGWNTVADQLGFTVVYAEQSTANNPLRCFNWAGEYGDLANLTRGQGENASIMAMIDHALAAHDGDPARVYVTGFSAGGAFAAVMLATWPDRLAGGAILSGVPYRCATDVNGAYACQALSQHPERDLEPAAWATLVEQGSGGWTGPWPRVAIWHGSTDTTVDPAAARESMEQWTAVHGVTAAPEVETVGDASHEVYRVGGVPVVERWTVTGMGHAIVVGGADPDGGCTAAAAYYEDHGLCSTWRIARFWGLTGDD
ncbi:MAG: PHB depolymerase family esterase, partial [Myxococcales bacterium]|nr:PHB depolymerase family esterase [Myxococcales bacterium]